MQTCIFSKVLNVRLHFLNKCRHIINVMMIRVLLLVVGAKGMLLATIVDQHLVNVIAVEGVAAVVDLTGGDGDFYLLLQNKCT
jgi:hypothetical protein